MFFFLAHSFFCYIFFINYRYVIIVNSVFRKSVMFNNVVVDIAFPRHSFMFSQSSCEVSASLTDVGGVEVGAIDLIYCSMSVPRFVFA